MTVLIVGAVLVVALALYACLDVASSVDDRVDDWLREGGLPR